MSSLDDEIAAAKEHTLTEGKIVKVHRSGGVLDGIVTDIHPDGTTVDVQGWDGAPVDIDGVPFSEEPKADHWSWPPDDTDDADH